MLDLAGRAQWREGIKNVKDCFEWISCPRSFTDSLKEVDERNVNHLAITAQAISVEEHADNLIDEVGKLEHREYYCQLP